MLKDCSDKLNYEQSELVGDGPKREKPSTIDGAPQHKTWHIDGKGDKNEPYQKDFPVNMNDTGRSSMRKQPNAFPQAE